jgi:hypothetical protein
MEVRRLLWKRPEAWLFKRTRDDRLYERWRDDWLYKRRHEARLYKRRREDGLYKRTRDDWLYNRTRDARKSCGSHEVARRERSVIRDNHRGTAVVGTGCDWSTDRPIRWNKLRFCQHNTGDGHKSEEHLQNREQDISLT